MKRLPAIFAALLLLTSCRENSAMPDNRPASQEHPPTASDAVPTNEELSAYAEEHLAAYRYHVDRREELANLTCRQRKPSIPTRFQVQNDILGLTRGVLYRVLSHLTALPSL